MPNTKSAKKRLRQNQEKRAVNRAKKSATKTQIRKVLAAMDEGDFERADSEFRLVQKKLDKIASQGVYHPNKSARIKARLSARIKAAKTGASS